LITIASIIYDFTSAYVDAAVFIQGTTPSRTRRYQIGINKFWFQINPLFEIMGLKNDEWSTFHTNENYEAFLGYRKSPLLF
jgi:hypothetical protein